MSEIFKHEQQKKNKKGFYDNCKIYVNYDNDKIHIRTFFNFTYYFEPEKIKQLVFQHEILYNVKTGTLKCGREMVRIPIEQKSPNTLKLKFKSRNFYELYSIINKGLYSGERGDSWGKRYDNAINKLFNVVYEILSKEFKHNYLINKEYLNQTLPLYRLFVDHHLTKKKIKFSNNVYNYIVNYYPTKNSLVSNNNNFILAMLNDYDLNTSFLSKFIINNKTKFNLDTLKFFVILFGKSYTNYLPEIEPEVLTNTIKEKKIYFEAEDFEKPKILKILNTRVSDIDSSEIGNSIYLFYKFKKFAKTKGITYKFNYKNGFEFYDDYKKISFYEGLIKNGYCKQYDFPEDFLVEIEKPIIIDNKRMNVTILKNEIDFMLEGYEMSNCMGKQFKFGLNKIFFRLDGDIPRLNISYKEGKKDMLYAKANVRAPSSVSPFIMKLNDKMKKYGNLNWVINFEDIEIKI